MIDKHLISQTIKPNFPKTMEVPLSSYKSVFRDVAVEFSAYRKALKPMVETVVMLKDIAASLKPLKLSILETHKKIATVYSEISKTLPPVIQWFKKVDFSSILTLISDIDIDIRQLDEFHTIYLMAMYECKWFPYAGWIADENLFTTVDEIIATSRGLSKRREKRIDKAILSYYTEKEIKRIKNNWKQSDLDYCIKKSICQSIDAYFRGEYALTISCLATMWEGLIFIRTHHVSPEERQRQNMNITRQNFSDLVMANDYDAIFSNYFDNYIMKQCNKASDMIEGVPNRHGISHSWYKKYPNKKAALNAILLTDFIINLEPISILENKKAG